MLRSLVGSEMCIRDSLILYYVNPILTGSGIFFFSQGIFFFQLVYNAVIYRHSDFWELCRDLYCIGILNLGFESCETQSTHLLLVESSVCRRLNHVYRCVFCAYCDDPSFSFLCYCNLIFHFAALPISSHLDETLQSRIYANFKR